MKRLRCLFIAAAIIGLVFWLAPSSQASLQGTTGWLVTCPYDHSLPDDPIVFPNQPGASHLHDFIANRTTNANSTYSTMVAAATTCLDPGDTAGYWVPALYRNGVKISPAVTTDSPRNQVYYRADNLAAGTHITPFPPNFRMIVGNSHATDVSTNPQLGSEIYYGCSDNSPDVKATSPINCSTGIISIHFGFPNCWDGVNLDSPDHKSHVTYPGYPSGLCPADHPVALPRVILRLEYAVGPDSSGITLASGATYTEHGDFWNTWNQDRLNALVADCLNQQRDCGTPNGANVGPTPSATATATPSPTVSPTSSPTPSPSPSPSVTPSPSPSHTKKPHPRHP